MSISDLFDSGFRNRNKGHFSAIVRVALSDGIIGPEEKYFLDKLAIKLEISQAEYEEILENPLKYPVNPPLLHTHRLERLYDLSRMVYADEHVLGEKEHELLKKFALALGFTAGNVGYIVDKALKLVDMNVDLDTFTYERTDNSTCFKIQKHKLIRICAFFVFFISEIYFAFAINSSAFSTMFLLPQKNGTRWCNSVG